MRVLKSIILMVMLLILASCSRGENCYDIHKNLMDMKSYKSDVTIKVHGNKALSTYKVQHIVGGVDKIKLETIEPSTLKGKTVVFSENKWKIYHPLINEVSEFKSLKDIDEVVYMGIIKKDFFSNDKLEEKKIEKNGETFIEFKNTLPNSSSNRSYTKIYVEEKTKAPKYLEIYNEDNELCVEMEYSNFEYEPKIDEKEFEINKK